MLGLDEAAALFEPIDVDSLRKIVLDQKSDDQDQAGDEGEADEIMHILGALRDVAEGLGPDSGSSTILPKVMFNPVRPRRTKDAAVSQCENRSKALKRTIFLPERPADIRIRPRIK